MVVVKINVLSVPDGGGPELEKRFAPRLASLRKQPGFLGFEMLRPVAGEDRYFIYSRWESEEAYQNWRAGLARIQHSHPEGNKVTTGAELLEFVVVHAADPV
jgi:heme-degrading monooxygenase HmoA